MKVFNQIRDWAKERNIHTADCQDKQTIKLLEEAGELANAHLKRDVVAKIDAVGDIVVVLTIYCLQNNLKIEDCIEHAYEEIKNRKGKTIDGTFIKD